MAIGDSTDLIHWDRVGVTPEDAAEWVAVPSARRDEDAAEFAERFIARYTEIIGKPPDGFNEDAHEMGRE